MAYCSECGIYCQEDAVICASCGCNLLKESTLGAEASPATSSSEPETVNLTENMDINSRIFSGDSQLGKGIIKPQKVELGTDGIHFKYDAPAHSFVIAEPVKEKPREYRATDLDMKSGKTADMYYDKESLTEEPAPPVLENIAAETEEFVPEITPEPVIIPGLELEAVPDIEKTEEFPAVSEPEPAPEPVVPEEPVIEAVQPEHIEAQVIWEAGQTWLRIPRGNVYRLTGSSLIIQGKYNDRFLEVNLSLVTGVTLSQSWLAGLLGVGDLRIAVTGFATSTVVLGGIPEPLKVKQMLENLCRGRV